MNGKAHQQSKHIVKVGNHPHTNMISKPAIIKEESTMQDIENAFEIKRPASKNSLVYIQTAILKPCGKPKVYDRYTHKKEKGIQRQH